VIDDPTAKTPSPRLRGEGRGEGRREAPGGGRNRPHKPQLDEMGIALYHERQVFRAGGSGKGKPRKPTLDEMGPGTEAVPYRGPRSSLGRPGMRGGRKPERRR
jgi:excinuclease ABC subunit B